MKCIAGLDASQMQALLEYKEFTSPNTIPYHLRKLLPITIVLCHSIHQILTPQLIQRNSGIHQRNLICITSEHSLITPSNRLRSDLIDMIGDIRHTRTTQCIVKFWPCFQLQNSLHHRKKQCLNILLRSLNWENI